MVNDYQLYDIVEMKKAHPCTNRSKQFQIIRTGADIKIKCLGCGNVIMMDRDSFNHRIRRVIRHEDGIIEIKK